MPCATAWPRFAFRYTAGDGPTSCSQLAPHCDHASHGSLVRAACPMTCGLCTTATPVTTGTTEATPPNAAAATTSQAQTTVTQPNTGAGSLDPTQQTDTGFALIVVLVAVPLVRQN